MNFENNNNSRNDGHIYFIETNKYSASNNANNNTDLKTLCLLNSRYNINFLEIIPRKFKIDAENRYYYFNVDILKDTSRTITNLYYQHADSFELLSSKYNHDVFSKFEQLYQGNMISITKNEIKHYNIFKIHLKIDCMPALSTYDFNDTNEVYIQMDKNSFNSYLKKSAPRTFTITTKKAKYKCNIFGILASDVLREYTTKNPNERSFYYDIDDENNEFSEICELFNFKKVKVTENNMYILKEIAEELQIKCILNDIVGNFNKIEKISLIFDQYQDTVDSIDELFECLYNVKQETIPIICNKLLYSSWLKTEEKLQELAAFIIQVIRTSFLSHQNLIDLLITLSQNSFKIKQLNNLIPFIVDKLMVNFGNDPHECSFIFKLNKNGIISKQTLTSKIKEWKIENDDDYSNSINLILWFMPEISQIISIEDCLMNFTPLIQNWINSYYPSNLEQYKIMRNKGEPDDSLTIALRKDDIDRFQAILTFNNFDISKGIIPYNIYEDFIDNGKTNYINYAAAYGAVRCFKYLFLNHQKINELTFSYAIYGGNTEIIRIVYQNITLKNDNYDKKNIISTIQMHRNNLFDWIFEQRYLDKSTNELLMDLVICSAENGNAHSLIELIERGLSFDFFNQQKTGWDYYQNRNIFKNAIESSAKNGFYIVTELFYDIIKEKNELFIIKNITPYSEFGNLQILKTVSDSIQIQNKYGYGQFQSDDWFVNSVKSNNLNMIEYYFNEYNTKLGLINEKKIFKCLKYCVTENHSNLFKYLTTYLKKKNSKLIDKIFSELLPEECKSGNYFVVSNIVNMVSNKHYYLEYNVTDSFLNAAISESKQICDLLLNSKNLKIYYEDFLNHSDELSKINVGFFAMIYKNSPNIIKQVFLQNLLYPAIKNFNTKLVELLLKLNAPFEDSLFCAVNSRSLEMVEFILNFCSKPHFVNRISIDGTALCIAVKNQDIKIFNRLLMVPEIDTFLYDKDGNTPLLIAINNKNIDIAQTLIEFNGEKISQNEINKCLKKLFYYYNNEKDDIIIVSMVDFLIKKFITIKCIDPNVVYYDNNSLLFYAIENNDINLIKNLLQFDNINPNITTNDNYDTPLMKSIKNLNIEISEILIKNSKTNINLRNYHNKTALVMSVKRNLYDIIDMLIKNKNFNRKESNIKLAFSISNVEALKHLIKIKKLDVNNSTKLIQAINNKDIEMIDIIIHHQSFDKIKSKIDKAFITSLNSNCDEIIKRFIPLLDDVAIYKVNGRDLLSIAQDYSSSEILNLVIKHPSFDKSRFDINKAIDIASEKKNTENVNILKQIKAEKNKNKQSQSDLKSSKNRSIKSDSKKSEDKTQSNSNEDKPSKSEHSKTKTKSNQSTSNIDKNEVNQSTSKHSSSKSHQSNSKQNKTKSNQSELATAKSSRPKQSDTTNEKVRPNQSELTTSKNNRPIQSDTNNNGEKARTTKNIKPKQSNSANEKVGPIQTTSRATKRSDSAAKRSKSNQSNSTASQNKSVNSDSNNPKNKSVQSNSNTNKTKQNRNKFYKGIFNHLINKSNNMIEKYVNVTCSSCFSTDFQPQNVLIYDDINKSFWSKIMSNNWICFEFKNKKVIPSSYMIRSCNLAKGCSHPKSWVVEGSNDNVSWSIFDHVDNCQFLNGPGFTHLFKFQIEQKQSFKFIRMRITDIDCYGTDSLMIEAFELFGTLL